MPLDYHLSRSIVRLTARQTVSKNRILKVVTTSYAGSTAELLSVSDPTAPKQLDLPESDSKTSATSAVVFLSDRRLASIETSSSGRGPDWLKAGLSVGSVLLGAVVAVANPVAGLGIAVAGAKLSQKSTQPIGEQGFGTQAETDEQEPDPIDTAYLEEHPLEAEVRTGLREAAESLARELSSKAESAALPELKAIRGRLNLIKEQLAPFEEHRARWEAALVTETAQVDLVDFEIDDLPTEAALKEFLEDHAKTPTPSAAPDDNGWREWAIRTQLAVTIDAAPRTASTATKDDDQASSEDFVVYYREGVDATAVTWSITWVPKSSNKDAGGNEVEVPGRFRASRISEQRVRVVSRNAAVHELSLDKGAWISGKLRVTFNELGEPAEIGGDAKALAPEAIVSAPGAVSEGLELGGKISGALVPGSATQTAVDRALAIAKARKELSPLLSTEKKEETELSRLQDDVELAELQARLELAKAASAGSGIVLVHRFGGA